MRCARPLAPAVAATVAVLLIVVTGTEAVAAPAESAARPPATAGPVPAGPPSPWETVPPVPTPFARPGAIAPARQGPGPGRAAASAVAAVTYHPPVDGPLVDRFRPPATAYGPGNRGVDYATDPGTPVRAAAAGQVAFAGGIGGDRHVVVLHADGIRTSYSFLAAVGVGRGQLVAAGEPLGTAGATLHFGARAGDAYLDPLVLLAGPATGSVRLVPDGGEAMASEAEERGALRRFLGTVGGAVAGVGLTAVDWARGTTEAVAGALPGTGPATWMAFAGPAAASGLVRTALAISTMRDAQGPCTPEGIVPPPPPGRRRLVLVAGLASTSRGAGVDGVDAAALGYSPADVVRFSYRGGTTEERGYDARDTQIDIVESGRRLRELLERLHAGDPGLPIDVVAHSQGGLVARMALGARAPPGVTNLVTLATPHRGADLATVLAAVGRTPKGAAVQGAVSAAGVTGIDPRSTSVGQLAETSELMRSLRTRPLPPGVRVTSIAARADVIVPSPRSRLEGAANVVVAVPGLNDHAELPGAAAATREMALALAGMAPTCQALLAAVRDAVLGEAIGTGEDILGVGLISLGW